MSDRISRRARTISVFALATQTTLDLFQYSNCESHFSKPTNLALVSLTENTAAPQWRDNSDFETQFQIEQAVAAEVLHFDSIGQNATAGSARNFHLEIIFSRARKSSIFQQFFK